MSISPYRIVLSGGFGSVTIASDRQAAEASSGLRVDWDSGGVAGWDSAPDAKVSSTERQAGDGAHDVSESDIEYESRVVTVNIAAFGETRDEVLAAMRRLQAAHKQLVTMRVVDAATDTYCERGYVVVKWDEEWHEQTATGTLTAVFVRPHRLSTLPSEGVMVPATGGGGGLVFDAVTSGSDTAHVLHWPLSFGDGAIRTGNSCTIYNNGTIPADITITASGYMPGGIAVTDTSTGRQLAYGQTVTWSGLTLDSRTRTASVAGVDVSRSLTSRDFPTVPAGGSVTLSLQASGTGTLTATCHDTYI